jgi:hypothetical protein
MPSSMEKQILKIELLALFLITTVIGSMLHTEVTTDNPNSFMALHAANTLQSR